MTALDADGASVGPTTSSCETAKPENTPQSTQGPTGAQGSAYVPIAPSLAALAMWIPADHGEWQRTLRSETQGKDLAKLLGQVRMLAANQPQHPLLMEVYALVTHYEAHEPQLLARADGRDDPL